ncbi:MAG: 4-hydroxy-tetrahydrodipicolinate synthase, partial [Candidatus Cryptobacteroides sp.]|nr:4-hydroxy-tetrahydrodipicolinate synthase [Candidatus Cryptobacteroides sp.]
MILRGCGTALVTPFRDGKVDFEAYGKMVRRQVEAGIDFLVPLGSTAETPCLEDDEKVELLRIARELCPDKPVVVGVGTNSPVATIRNIRLLEPYGPDAWLVVVPYYNKPPQEGLYQHFKAIAESTDLPIILYNIPPRTGNKLAPETVRDLIRDVDVIVGAKDSSGDIENLKAYIRLTRELDKDVAILAGNDGAILTCLKEGGAGGIAGRANIWPKTVASIYDKFV